MYGYEKIKCRCGRNARIVVCGVGCYIRCPYCEKSTYMCTTKSEAIKKWKMKEEYVFFFIFGKEETCKY